MIAVTLRSSRIARSPDSAQSGLTMLIGGQGGRRCDVSDKRGRRRGARIEEGSEECEWGVGKRVRWEFGHFFQRSALSQNLTAYHFRQFIPNITPKSTKGNIIKSLNLDASSSGALPPLHLQEHGETERGESDSGSSFTFPTILGRRQTRWRGFLSRIACYDDWDIIPLIWIGCSLITEDVDVRCIMNRTRTLSAQA